ncbi:MAG TPA: HAD hydrolase-like protein [Cyclobacteriaceae bacterium]|nr:HAD hydrolase-like protein [Cyclobacteriaceae bacterium]
MKTDLVIFDLAGTTVKDNNDVPRILQRTLAKFDTYITLDEAIDVMGISKPVAIQKLLEKYNDDLITITSDGIDAIHKVFVEDMIDFYKNDASIGEKDGVSGTFEILRKNNIKVAVDTGFDRQITDVLLERLRWKKDKLIDFSITSDEVLRGRPFPDMIFKALEHFSINDPACVAKVGDTPVDLQEGSAAGCGLVIGVTSGAFPREVLELEKHTHLISAIPEILPILNLKQEHQLA